MCVYPGGGHRIFRFCRMLGRVVVASQSVLSCGRMPGKTKKERSPLIQILRCESILSGGPGGAEQGYFRSQETKEQGLRARGFSVSILFSVGPSLWDGTACVDAQVFLHS